MATIPSFKEWMHDTGASFSPRSGALQHLDSVLRGYEKQPDAAMRQLLSDALEAWKAEQRKQGKDWHKSVRNQKGAVTNLGVALSGAPSAVSDSEREALAHLVAHQQEAMQLLFANRRVEWKANTLMGMKQAVGTGIQQFSTLVDQGAQTGSAASTVKHIVTGAQVWVNNVDGLSSNFAPSRVAAQSRLTRDTLETIRGKLVEFLSKLCPPGVDINQVLNSLGLGSAIEFAAKVAPFFGMVTSGKDAVFGLKDLASAIVSRRSIGQVRSAIRPGDPEMAFDAILVMLNRDIGARAADAGRASLAFIGQSLMALFTGPGVALTGPIISAINLFAQIVHSIIEMARDHSERVQANRLLDAGAINWDLFEVCPLLGCYFVAVQDHSTLINLAASEFNSGRYVYDAERLIKKLRPVVRKAGEVIRASRLEIPGMQRYKGIADANISKKGAIDQLTSVGSMAMSQISQSLESHAGKPDPRRGPNVDRARIHAISHDTKRWIRGTPPTGVTG